MQIQIGTQLKVTDGPHNSPTFRVVNIDWNVSYSGPATMTFICKWDDNGEEFNHSQHVMVEDIQEGVIAKVE